MSQNKSFLDEINKLAGTAFSSAVQAKDSVMEFIKQHIDTTVKSKDLVSREEFEAFKDMVMKKLDNKKSSKKKSCAKKMSQ